MFEFTPLYHRRIIHKGISVPTARMLKRKHEAEAFPTQKEFYIEK
jgi:hypothetical protein